MSYKDARAEAAQQVSTTSLPCRACNNLTAVATLSDFGGMCIRCYRGWVNRPLPPATDAGDKNRGERDWAQALKRRELAGERLTPFQRQAWREALKEGGL